MLRTSYQHMIIFPTEFVDLLGFDRQKTVHFKHNNLRNVSMKTNFIFILLIFNTLIVNCSFSIHPLKKSGMYD